MNDETSPRVASAATHLQFSKGLSRVGDHLGKLLLERHKHHGNAVFEPEGVFSKASAKERVLVMLDYKISRYKQGSEELQGENLDDMIGYLLLLKMME